MANFDLTNLAVKMICPNNVVKTDDTNLPSVLVYIPKFKNSDVLTGGNDSTHPAFIVNGVEIPGFYYGKYQAKVYNSVAYSLPGEDPTASINFDTARARCEAKGAGWHLSTNAEWAAIALWCKKNGFLPYGNNNYGKDSRESNYKAVPSYYESNKIARVATGTGPISWSHDKTMAGIWDLNGNVWEWQGGIRLVWGELQILANNDAADPDNPQNATSTCWKAINAADGALVDPESKTTDSSAHVSGKTVKLDYVNNKWTYSTSITNAKDESRSCAFYQVAADSSIGDAAKVMLRALALLPDSDVTTDVYEGDYMWWNNGVAERCVYRGGNWNNGANAGVFYLNGNNSRSNANTNIGFRAALALFVYFLRAKAQQKHQGKRDAFPGRQGQRYTLVLLCRWRPPGTPSKPRRLAVVCYAGRRGIRILRRGDRRGKISPRNVTTRAIIMTTQGGTRTWIQETSPPFWREYTRGRIFWTHTTRQQARSGTATT